MNKESTPAPEVEVDELALALKDGAQLIDVRDVEEYAQGHVPQARLIPLANVLEYHKSLDRHRPVYVICASGHRSMAAAGALRQVGIDAQSVAGGTFEWAKQQRPISTGTDSP